MCAFKSWRFFFFGLRANEEDWLRASRAHNDDAGDDRVPADDDDDDNDDDDVVEDEVDVDEKASNVYVSNRPSRSWPLILTDYSDRSNWIENV